MYLGDLPPGHTIRHVNAGRPLHHVDDRILVLVNMQGDSVLKLAIEKLCEGEQWYACTMFASGRGLMRGPWITSPRPDEGVCEVMRDLAVLLNGELHHGGHWVTVWSNERLHALWRDADGDARLVQTFDEPWVRLRAWPITEFAERCEAAWQTALAMVRSVGVTPAETILAAQGQQGATRH